VFAKLRLRLAAEHGFFVKPDGHTWRALGRIGPGWKDAVLSLLQAASAGLPGSHIEQKESAVVWHYRSAGPTGEAAARELHRRLGPLLPPLGLVAVAGHKMLELRPAAVHKGQIGEYWLPRGRWDFVLAAGDDATDEDLFAAMPPGAYTVKVGPGPTRATRRLATPGAFTELLAGLAALGKNWD
jgi:trehalose 6-phosphate synthase/phosphatase